MTKKLGLSRASRSRSLAVVSALTILAVVSLTRPVDAQLSRVGGVATALNFLPVSGIMGTDAAYDPTTGQYLVVGARGGPIVGACTNTFGVPNTFFVIRDGVSGHYPRVEFSPHVPNGAGGSGAFLVTWHHLIGGGNAVFSRIVTCAPNSPSRLLGVENQLSGADPTWWLAGASIAYSPASGRFLVVWQGAIGGSAVIQSRAVDVNGNPVSGVNLYASASRDPSVAWNPATNEFGVGYSAWAGYSALIRVSAADGSQISAAQAFGFSGGNFNTDLAVNSAGQYVMVFVNYGGTQYALLNSAGALLNAGLVSGGFGGNDNMALDYNPVSGTFLAVGQHNSQWEIGGAELNFSGFPITGTLTLTSGGVNPGSLFPRTAARTDAAQWAVTYSQQYATGGVQIIATSSTGGGPAGPAPAPPPSTPAPTPPAGGCPGSDPFASIGGGHCSNGGWVPGPGSSTPAPTPAPAPAPTPSTGGCNGPDPFASLGGGLCQNGGWIMAGTGCAGSDPFTSIGGGHCSNGGWVPGPGSSTPAPTPTAPAPPPPTSPAPTTPSSCAGSDPFVSIGGGHCSNGGWVPGPGSSTPAPAPPPPAAPPPTSSSGCAGPDPFASLGGGVCVGGGWQMPNMSCSTPNPFTSLPGGGVCINGGWLPAGMGGAPAPAPALDASAPGPSLIVQTFAHEAPPADAADGKQKAELRT